MQSSIVASVQFKPEPEEIDKNISIAKQMAFEAAAKGARVIVLPEMCTSGNGFKSVRDAALCAQSKDGYQTESFIPLARKFNCHIVFGYPEFDDNFLYNSAAIVGPNGLEANIRKHNLWGNDNFWATSSDQIPPVVVTAAGRLGALISRDISNTFRESYAFYKKGQKFYSRGSVDTLALLSNWDDQFGYPDSRWIDLNESLDSNLIISNRVGAEGNLKFRGGSCIIGRDRKVWTNGSSFKESAVVGGMIII
jgi:predicted amidohydrolase